MVLWHLNAIFMFVFLNRFVILRMCGEMKVNVTHFLFLFMFVCGTNPLMKHTTHKRTLRSPCIKDHNY